MNWLQRLRSNGEEEVGPEAPGAEDAARRRRGAPGAAALFEGLEEGGGHAVLDLGPATSAHFALYGRYARRICFADLVPHPPRGRALLAALDELPVPEDRAYDVVLLWNVLDRIGPEERTTLLERLTGLTAPPARLYAVVETSEEPTTRPRRFTLEGPGTVVEEAAGPEEPAGSRLLPAEMERILAPWEVARAFTLRSGFREYLAVRR